MSIAKTPANRHFHSAPIPHVHKCSCGTLIVGRIGADGIIDFTCGVCGKQHAQMLKSVIGRFAFDGYPGA